MNENSINSDTVRSIVIQVSMPTFAIESQHNGKLTFTIKTTSFAHRKFTLGNLTSWSSPFAITSIDQVEYISISVWRKIGNGKELQGKVKLKDIDKIRKQPTAGAFKLIGPSIGQLHIETRPLNFQEYKKLESRTDVISKKPWQKLKSIFTDGKDVTIFGLYRDEPKANKSSVQKNLKKIETAFTTGISKKIAKHTKDSKLGKMINDDVRRGIGNIQRSVFKNVSIAQSKFHYNLGRLKLSKSSLSNRILKTKNMSDEGSGDINEVLDKDIKEKVSSSSIDEEIIKPSSLPMYTILCSVYPFLGNELFQMIGVYFMIVVISVILGGLGM
eukprot:TRINITY_DN2320_c2_g1_i2.p1 TRINITY_DN2320_c2_g1~~TRINITY_DN2320_c2_g1_i2.p1  ORF type:complete len:329 (-),score=56.04 TRINITY_DN2320_c2_g1_i2:191-1177(-)